MSLANKFGMSLYVIKRDKITQKVVLKMSKALSPQTLDDIHLKMRGAAVGDELVLRWKRIGAPAGDMPVQWKGIIAESYSTATATAIVRWSAGANQKGMTAGGLYAFPTPMLTNGTVEGELTILPALEVGARQPTPKHKPPRAPQLASQQPPPPPPNLEDVTVSPQTASPPQKKARLERRTPQPTPNRLDDELDFGDMEETDEDEEDDEEGHE